LNGDFYAVGFRSRLLSGTFARQHMQLKDYRVARTTLIETEMQFGEKIR